MKRIADATYEDNRNLVKSRASDAEAYLQHGQSFLEKPSYSTIESRQLIALHTGRHFDRKRKPLATNLEEWLVLVLIAREKRPHELLSRDFGGYYCVVEQSCR
jgi:hypothetical protein